MKLAIVLSLLTLAACTLSLEERDFLDKVRENRNDPKRQRQALEICTEAHGDGAIEELAECFGTYTVRGTWP